MRRDEHLSLPLSLSLSLSLFQKTEAEPREVKSPIQGHTARKCPAKRKAESADSHPDSCLRHLTVMSNLHVNLTDHRVPRLNIILAVSVRVFPGEIGI